jgi:hypothetical protein
MNNIIEINDFDVDLLNISDFKNIDNSFLSKIRYNNEKFVLKICSCKVVEFNQSIIVLKTCKRDCKKFSLIENEIINQAKHKIISDKKELNIDLNVNKIKDNIIGNITIDPTYGNVLKFKHNFDLVDVDNVDLYIRPNIVKISQVKSKISWNITEVFVNEYNPKKHLIVESSEDEDYDYDNDGGPFKDEIEDIQSNLLCRLEKIESKYNDVKEKITCCKQKILAKEIPENYIDILESILLLDK